MADNISRSKLILPALLRFGLGVPMVMLVVFAPAGSWTYWQGWMYLATLFIPMFFGLAYLFKHDPALLERRMRLREKEATQRKVVAFSWLYFVVSFSLPGLDVRFGWSNLPVWVSILANVLVFCGYMVFFWVMRVNSYLSRVVEVDVGQKVISNGPYGLVRHPRLVSAGQLFFASKNWQPNNATGLFFQATKDIP